MARLRGSAQLAADVIQPEETGLTYIPAHEMAGYYNDKGFDPKTYDMDRDGPMGLNAFHDDIPKSAASSSLIAWDALRRKKAWEVALPGATNGGVMSTRGGLLFQGQADGKFVARDDRTGTELWSANMGVGSAAAPITYSVGGQQYVSILAGWAGGHMLLGSLSAQHGWVGRGHPRRLLTYVLGGRATVPAAPPPSQPVPITERLVQDRSGAGPERAAVVRALPDLPRRGRGCRGLRARSAGLADCAQCRRIRRRGSWGPGEPRHAAVSELSAADLAALRHYIRQRAQDKPTFSDRFATFWHYLILMLKMKLKAWGWI